MLRPQLGLVIKNLEIQSSVLYDFSQAISRQTVGLTQAWGCFFQQT